MTNQPTTTRAGHIDTCINICRVLESPERWNCLPRWFVECTGARDSRVRNRWGRVGIEFGQWWEQKQPIEPVGPGILIGFLHNPAKHKVRMVDELIGIDLLFTFDVGNTGSRPDAEIIRSCAARLQLHEPALKLHINEECKEKRQVLIVQEALTDVTPHFTGDSSEIMAIYNRFYRWAHTLFDGGELEAEIRRRWPIW